MSKKYVAQVNSTNFVYPNNTLVEYDVDIIHDINNNSVSGTVTNFVTTFSLGNTRLNYSFDYTWSKNNAEPYIQENGHISLLSVHVMVGTNLYFKPYQLIVSTYDDNPNITTYTEHVSGYVTVTGGGYFPSSDYYFEFRFIGHRAIFPVCITKTIVGVTPTPTPTKTGTPTPTPTSTPGLTTTPTPTPTASSGVSTATLGWSYSETGGANAEMRIYVNSSVVETRTNTSSGTWTGLVAGDTIYVQLELLSSCSGPDNKGNVYTSSNRATLVDASCFTSSTGTLTTPTYTVVSGDIGTTITLNTFASCDSGCL